MESTDIQVFYNYWVDGSCYHTSKKHNWIGMGVYSVEVNTIYPVPIHRKLAVSGPRGTHNDAEYLAIMCALTDIYIHEGAVRSGATYAVERRKVVIHSDSQLIIRQINGEYEAKQKSMKLLLEEVGHMVRLLNNMGIDLEFKWNPRDTPNQKIADHLSKVGNRYFSNIQPDDTISHGITDIEDALIPEPYKAIKYGLHWKPNK